MYARGELRVNRRAYTVRRNAASTYAPLTHNKYEPQPPKRIQRKPFGFDTQLQVNAVHTIYIEHTTECECL